MNTTASTSLASQGMELLRHTFEKTKTLVAPIVIGAAVIAGLMTLVQYVFLAGAMTSGGIIGYKMTQLQNMGDSANIDPEMMAAMGGALGTVILMGIVMAIASFILSSIASAYYLIVYLKHSTDAGVALKETSVYLIPLIGVWIVTAFRSLIWIPIVGLIFALIWGPRMALAPYILVTEKTGVMKSVSTSFDWTKGKWSQVVVPLLVVGIIVWIASAIIGSILSSVVYSVPFASSFIENFCRQFAVAFGMGALVGLAPRFKK